MPWVKDKELFPEHGTIYLAPARVQLAVCGERIFQRAAYKDSMNEKWLAIPIKPKYAG